MWLPPVRPRSLLSAVLGPRAELVDVKDVDAARVDWDSGFTVLGGIRETGLIRYQEFPFGVDRPRDIGEGWTFAIDERATWHRVAVVPDGDGHVRGRWPSLGP